TIIIGSVNLFSFQNSFAHNFSPDESAHFLTMVDKIKVESELATNNMGNNNSSAQLHANNALLNYDSHAKDELGERNERIATELDDTLNQLLEQAKSQTDQSQLTDTAETIAAILDEAISARIDVEQVNNSTIQALVLASIVDTALQNYGDAYNVGFDLTNMSNLNKETSTNETTTNNTTTNGHTDHPSTNISIHSNIVSHTNYESALAFSNNALEKFHNDISTASLPLSEKNNTANSQTYLKKLENGLTEFNNAIKNKENPIKVMEIVHTKIHPNLQILFNLKID
ncbi:MAG TPA: hypothetical protein VFK40_09755, partial [Nitrososphaeraceae archaeon]|nr:hypothetical protein [Nitrososphaeraceae archaeon]